MTNEVKKAEIEALIRTCKAMEEKANQVGDRVLAGDIPTAVSDAAARQWMLAVSSTRTRMKAMQLLEEQAGSAGLRVA